MSPTYRRGYWIADICIPRVSWWRVLGLGPRCLTVDQMRTEISRLRHAARWEMESGLHRAGRTACDLADALRALEDLLHRLDSDRQSAPAVLRDYLALAPDARPGVLVEKDHTGHWQAVESLQDMPVIDVGRDNHD